MSALVLPAVLARAGCALVVVGRQLAVLDRDGHELARGPRKQTAWLWIASTAALIARRAEALVLHHELHPEQLSFRLWRAGENPAAAPWQSFTDALASLEMAEHAICRPVQLRGRVVRSEPITRGAGPGAIRAGRGRRGLRQSRLAPGRGRAAPARSRRVAAPEPIRGTQELHRAGASVISDRAGAGQPDQGTVAVGRWSAGPGWCRCATRSEPIRQAQELPCAGARVLDRLVCGPHLQAVLSVRRVETLDIRHGPQFRPPPSRAAASWQALPYWPTRVERAVAEIHGLRLVRRLQRRRRCP